MADIIRDDPYADQTSSAPVTWGTPAMYGRSDVPPTAVPNPIATESQPVPPAPPPPSPATLALAEAGAAAAPPNTPLSQTGYAGQQIGSAEARKDTVEREANNLSKGQEEIVRINREAEAEQRRMLFGNPEDLLKAQQKLQAAQALPPDDPNRQLQIVQAQDTIMKNTGAQPLLAKAMEDAKARDEILRADIAKAHAYSQSKAAEVDPERYWNSKTTEGKVLAGIGIVLSGMGGGMTGSNRNMALEQMNRAIDNDIAAQQANIKTHIEGNWKQIADKHQLNQDAFNQDLHRQVWENNFRTSALETIKLKLGSAAAMTQSETVKNNAVNMIQTLTDEQAKIRNDQWRLAVSAQQAELNRMRALSTKADGDVQKLVEGGKYTYEEATDMVYSRPQNRGLIGAGMAPPEQAQRVMLKTEFSRELEKQKAQAKLLGAEPGSEKYNKIIGVVTENPRYAPIFQTPGGGVVADVRVKEAEGKTKGAESVEQLLNRTVYTPGPNGTTIPKQAVNKKAADDYKEYSDAAPDVAKAQASLVQAWKDGDVGKYNAARGQLIDAMPKFMLGSGASGPTRAQAQETYGKLIPPYSHWYGYPGEGKESGKFTPIGKAFTDPQSRTDEAFGVLDQMIKGRKETMESSTFGAAPSNTPPPATGSAPKIDFKPTTDFKPQGK